jgi:hypothetical protein
VWFLSLTYEGKASDKSVAEFTDSTLPPSCSLYQEKGIQGFRHHGIMIFQPKKIAREGQFTPREKATRRHISFVRIRREHAIDGVKRDRIVKDNIHLLTDEMRDAVMETCVGLQNFRLQDRPWLYAF